MAMRVPNPYPQFCQVLHRESEDTATLSIACDGKNHTFTLTKARLHRLLSSGHEALADMERLREAG
jgi:hypothetical protein